MKLEKGFCKDWECCRVNVCKTAMRFTNADDALNLTEKNGLILTLGDG